MIPVTQTRSCLPRATSQEVSRAAGRAPLGEARWDPDKPRPELSTRHELRAKSPVRDPRYLPVEVCGPFEDNTLVTEFQFLTGDILKLK